MYVRTRLGRWFYEESGQARRPDAPAIVLLHGLQTLAARKVAGARWLAWLSGVLLVGLFRTDFNLPPFGLRFAGVPIFIVALLPLIGLGVAGVAVIILLRERDLRRARAEYDKTTFKVPTRKTAKL